MGKRGLDGKRGEEVTYRGEEPSALRGSRERHYG